jgi:hypothetical protein
MDLYKIWAKFHRAILDLAVRNAPMQAGLLKALSEIESLRSEDFPEDLQARFAKLEAKLEAEMAALKDNSQGLTPAAVKNIDRSDAHEVILEIASLYEELSRRVIGGDAQAEANLL